ncbi:homoserine kinase [Anabaena cylindrica FACHB-243]|uniref:Homoserine kinase n=1 Tax=Anabaena cylindrica (strain ATCC 27899 / PCC 7122) TaxID=272123 RepID=K9ZJL6_ANACC|nr:MULTISPECIES: homoserine kinase [Anabaena]AFZ59401.1 homoserine kinase [Anabaena cylindrica PCC 7122]MBD2417557.1 homoserine kinase [Anabaena cylindrica FACHB-243]MBY5280219.1 homoserine kinase [Anabaena sp. CCAP 1446/1C]MBY5308491.1 homoserine kinase [Anabaena sp. CCAP 1446/1C]MCM2405318.1 homoserine kinase [Anabaena sp. CCAP 1446/1C]
MSLVSTVTVKVPATTANLGPGFDCIGAALKLYNEVKFTRLDAGGLIIQVSGAEAEKVQTDESNLLYQAFVKLYQYIEQTPPSVKIEIKLGVPLARGLGSSATAIVGGLVAANQLAGSPLSELQVMELAIAMEGHPDNVVPALLGGCRLAATSLTGWEICDVTWHRDIVPVVAIPDFELSTSEARRVLPTEVSRADAIFNIAHFGLLLRGLATNRQEWLKAALQDKLHQPYRQALIPGYEAVNTAAVAAGAYGMVISGAGPTLLALADASEAKTVGTAMLNAWKQEGITSIVRSLPLDTQGVTIS